MTDGAGGVAAAPGWGRLSGRPPRWAIWFGIGVALLFLVPTSLIGAPSTSPTSAPSVPAGPVGSTAPVPAPAARPSSGGVPGTNPASNVPLTPQDVAIMHARLARDPAAPVNASPALSNASELPPRVKSMSIPPEGWFVGAVNNASDPTENLSGVTVQAFADASSNPCPNQGPGACLPAFSNSAGVFNVTCEVGPDYLTFELNGFAENLTYANCQNDTTVFVGTSLLVPEGFVIGSVHIDEAGFPALAGVQVQGCNRGCSVISQPTVSTNSSGGFRVPVPPGTAAQIDFIPPGTTPIYSQNFTTVEAASGQTVNVGMILLEPNSVVKAVLYNAVTKQPLPGGYAAITVCSLSTTVCGPQGPTSYSNTVEAVGPPGYDYAIVMDQAGGEQFLVNQTPIGDVPLTSHGQPYCVPYDCKIFLTPLGGVEATVGISGDWQSLFDSGNTGLYTFSAASLDGLLTAVPRYNPATYNYNMTTTGTLTGGCQSVTSTVEIPAFPLRDSITVAPDTGGVCGFAGTPTWPIPGDLPVWANSTVANVTPNELTPIGDLNLTPGAYVMGHVYAGGTNQPPTGGYQVQISSRISGTVATYSWPNNAYGGPYYPPSPCAKGADNGTLFCAPAPPGPDVLKVTSTNYPQNETWVSVPWSPCCVRSGSSGLDGLDPLANVTAPAVDSVNLTGLGSVNGTIVAAGTGVPIPFAAVTVCTAPSQVSGGCEDAITNYSGGFLATGVAPGWQYVTATASGDQSNSEWVNVSGPTPTTPLPLQRLATLTGRVESESGSPIIGAGVTYCLVDGSGSSNSCSNDLGAGVTQSDGTYLGLLPGGNFPWATYEIEASAPGYNPDWTFVNVSAASNVQVPTLVLSGIGQSSVPAAGPVAGPVAPAAVTGTTWVTGRVVDNVTGDGVIVNSMTACSVANPASCVSFVLGTNSGGFFNQSVPLGAYNLTIVASGYTSRTVALSAFVVPNAPAGTIYLDPEPWVEGNVTLSPWQTVNVSISHSQWVEIPLLPSATAEICNAFATCTSSVTVGSSGLFEVPSLVGDFMAVTAVPNAPGGTYTAPGGALRGIAVTNITAGESSLPPSAWPEVALFVTVSGTVWNADSWNATSQNYTTPAWWAQVDVSTSGAITNALATETTNVAGQYAVFLPGGNGPNSTEVIALGGQQDIWYSTTVRINATLGPGQNFTWTVAPIPLVQFGWADLTLRNPATGAPAVGAGVSATYTDTVTGRSGSSAGEANGAGYLNLSAPSGTGVQFLAGGSNDLNTTSFYASVPSGGVVNVTYPSAAPNGTVYLEPWGFVRSSYVDYAAPPGYFGTIVDQLTGRPIPNAQTAVGSSDIVYGSGGSQPSNLLGQFFSDAPVGSGDLLTVSHPGFVVNTTQPLDVRAGSTLVFPKVNLTGYGMVAGRVVADPGLFPVPGAQVKVCPGTSSFSPNCESQVTNATGWYWTTAYPATDTIYVSAPGFTANYTESFPVASDSWTELPAYVLIEYGGITGIVRGLPTGLPVGDASVAACSPLGIPVGPCSVTTGTLSNGSFSISITPGSFVLAASALDYNTSYLPVSVNPGEVVNVGAVFLTEFGVVSGTVLDAASGLPVDNVTVDACPVDTLLPCSASVHTGIDGTYRIPANPGPIALTFAGRGYEDSYLTLNVSSGATVTAPTVSLVPVNAEIQYTVSGRVAPETNPSGGIPGAIVNFYVGGTRAYTAIASATGLFSLSVTAGAYSLVATAAGYGSASQPVRVGHAVAGLLFTLATWGWNVSLSVSDGLSHGPIEGAAVTYGTTALGITDAAGRLYASLPNGTYEFTVEPPASRGAAYASVNVTVEVSDAAVARAIDLYPPVATVSGTVRATSGAPIGGATVLLTGVAADGATVTVSRTASVTGAFTVPAYAGSYSISANASGYTAATQGLSLSGGPTTVTLTLTAAAGPTAGSSGIGAGAYLLAGVGIALAAAAVGLLLYAGRSKKEGRP